MSILKTKMLLSYLLAYMLTAICWRFTQLFLSLSRDTITTDGAMSWQKNYHTYIQFVSYII